MSRTAPQIRKQLGTLNREYLALRSYYDIERRAFRFSPGLHDIQTQITNKRNKIVELQTRLAKTAH